MPVPYAATTAAVLPATYHCAETVDVQAPGRLHLGFLDPAGSLGRRYGGIGLVIEGFETDLQLSAASGATGADEIVADSEQASSEVDRAAAYLRRLKHLSGRNAPLRLRLIRVLPAHTGFGSGTQLALAIGAAFSRWHGLGLDTPSLARQLGRGLRSGIGIAGFDQGGLMVDGGPSADGGVAPILARMTLPPAWRVLVVQDPTHAGLSGAAEVQALATLPPLPQAAAADICHQVLTRVLPGAACAEFAPFAAGIVRIQQRLGDHFAPAQGGSGCTSARVGRLLGWIAEHLCGAAATGQSSWGPTGFAILPSQRVAEAVVSAARAAGAVAAPLVLDIVAARDHGAVIRDHRGALAAH
jgi:beta-ribofuranosylaminobenzene 5'-phosphate synthase